MLKLPAPQANRARRRPKPSALHLWLCMYVERHGSNGCQLKAKTCVSFGAFKNDLKPNRFVLGDGDGAKARPVHRSHTSLFCSCPFLSPISKTDTLRRSRFDSHV